MKIRVLMGGMLVLAAVAGGSMEAQSVPFPGDPLSPLQWGRDAVNATGAWHFTHGEDRVPVAVVDSGVDLTHADLRDNLWEGNLLHGTSTARPFGVFTDLPVGPQDTTLDELDHGTGVAGIVGAVAENGVGGRGMAQVPLMVVKVYGLGAPGHAEALAEGIRWAVEHDARVVTMSMTGSDHPAVRAAVEEAWCAGVVLVAAAGNTAQGEPAYPARYPQVVSVGAVDRELGMWEGSNRGVDVFAPGVDVLTTMHGNLYMKRTGTSFAAPFVAGTAALMRSANPGISGSDVARLLQETGRPVEGLDAPLLDAGAAVQRAMTAPAVPAPDCPAHA